jgi:copper(I)-binding protein
MIDATSERSVPGRELTFSPTGRRWWIRVVLLTVLLCGTLTGCYAGRNAETLREIPATAGVDGGVGAVVLNDVFLEAAHTVPVGGSVVLRAAFTDTSPQPDRLTAVTTTVAAAVELLQPDGSVAADGIEVPGEGQVDGTTGPVLVRLTGLTRALSPQAIVPITFEFANAGLGTLDDVPVAASPSAGTE